MAVDVIRATTTAITAVARGHRVFVIPSIERAVPLAARLHRPLLVGELGGSQPYGFDLQNSPVAITREQDTSRPVILLSTSGTRLMTAAAAAGAAYAACLRNASSQVEVIAESHGHVRLVGADSRGEFREEDQLCCARIGGALVKRGFEPVDDLTADVLGRWATAPDDAFLGGRSARYLEDTGQTHDLEFVLDHVDDLDAVFPITDGELGMRELA